LLFLIEHEIDGIINFSMSLITDYPGNKLVWSPRSFFGNDYVLRCKDKTIAKLKVSMFGGKGIVETAENTLRFTGRGFLSRAYEVIDNGGTKIAFCQLEWFNRAHLECAGGQEFLWRWRGFFLVSYYWKVGDETIMTFKPRWSKTIVEVNRSTPDSDKLVLLACLGQFLIIVYQMSSS
jgi:hypothetical protein